MHGRHGDGKYGRQAGWQADTKLGGRRVVNQYIAGLISIQAVSETSWGSEHPLLVGGGGGGEEIVNRRRKRNGVREVEK